MRTLQDQLVRAGLAKEAPADEGAEKNREAVSLRNVGRQARSHLGESGDHLDSAATMAEFKHVAKELLLAGSVSAQTVLEKAHRFKHELGSQQFIWTFYEIRRLIDRCPADKLEMFLGRALRRNNPTVRIPE